MSQTAPTDADELEAMQQYLHWLTPKQRADFMACDVRGLTHAQQANDRDVQPPVVTQSVVSARRRLRSIAEEKGDL